MDKIVFISEKGNPITTSLMVAEYFGKNHKNVLRDIRRITETDWAQNWAQYWYTTTYTDNSGKQNEMYILSHKGLVLLIMGYKGKEALKIKVKYIEAFDTMEARLKAIDKPKLEYHDKVLNPSNTVTTTIIANDLGMSARELNKKLQERGIIYKMHNGTWMVVTKYRENGYTKTITNIFYNSFTQKDQTTHTLHWTERGREFINRIFTLQIQTA